METENENQPRHDLLIVDDQLIRQKYFSAADHVLHEMDQIEESILTYHSKDQRLFDQWHQVTFRRDQIEIEEAQKEFHELAQFHNWVVATAKIMDVEMHEAYALMKDEQRRWHNGSVEERKKIEADRQARDEFIQSEVQGRYNDNPSYQSEEAPENEIGAHLAHVLAHLEELMFPQDFEIGNKPPKERVEKIQSLSDEDLSYWLRDSETAFLLFDISLSWSELKRDFTFFLRIWDLLSANQQKIFSQVYSALTGQGIEELLQRVGGSAGGDEDEDLFSGENPKGANRASRRAARFKGENEEKLKSLYRKLIRQLHPDRRAHSGVSQDPKTNRLWDLVQKSYQARDLASLERLFQLTLLRTRALDQLSLDEISEAQRWLQKDLSKLKKETRHLKKSPAWGFSKRRDFSSLMEKIRSEFQQKLQAISRQVEDLRNEHRILDMLITVESSEIRSDDRDVDRPSRGRRRR
jgi:hypothetical protein